MVVSAEPAEAPQSATAAVDVIGVSKSFEGPSGTVHALRNVSLTIAQNEFFTLLGPSGCGKTTLLRLIAGFETPGDGEIRLDGEAIGDRPPYRRMVNTVFQSYALFPHMTVGQNIGFGLQMRGARSGEIRERVAEMLALVQLQGMEGRRPNQLSGGQQQRVALARALANHPKVLLLDEPLSALDFKLRKDMRLELKRLQRETGITFIFVTHDQEEALEMSDRVAVMSAGEVQQIAAPEEIYERPVNRFVADFIGETNFLEGQIEASGGPVLTLPGGASLAIADDGGKAGRAVSVAIRPERAEIAKPGGEGLAGTVDTVVYFGTDTVYYLTLDGGEPFKVRVQNREGARRAFAAGDRIVARVAPDAVQVLAD